MSHLRILERIRSDPCRVAKEIFLVEHILGLARPLDSSHEEVLL